MRAERHYYGVYLATVLDTNDPEELGRVRVDADQFSDTADDVLWATVLRPLAGDGPTVFFTPEPGDQVLIAFLAGDPGEPVVLGYAHHRGRRPEETSPTKHAIVTRAGRLTFDDESGRIDIALASGRTSVTLDEGGVHVTHGASAIEVSDASITIRAPQIVLQGQVMAPISVSTALLSTTSLQFGSSGGPASMEMPSGGLDITSPSGEEPFTVHGQPVVLERFLTERYNDHRHLAPAPGDSAFTGAPSEPANPADGFSSGGA